MGRWDARSSEWKAGARRSRPATRPAHDGITQVLDLQDKAGNTAVAQLLTSRPAWPPDLRPRVQRDATVGWNDPKSPVDPKEKFAWNAAKHSVGKIDRYPVTGLTQGSQRPLKGDPLSDESAAGRAIVLVPSGLVAKNPVTVLLHLHGYTETANRPWGGWRAHKVGAKKGKVRDVAHDRVAQQIEAANDPQIIGILPQGGTQSEFAASYNTFSSDAYIGAVFSALPADRKPQQWKVVMSAHSGGGFTVRSMLEAENRKRAGTAKDTDKFSTRPANLGGVVLFEAINNATDLATAEAWVTGKLDDLLAVVKSGKATDIEKALKETPPFRAYYGGSYINNHLKLAGTIRNWFGVNGDALGPYADRVWGLFQVVKVPVSQLTKPGQGDNAHENIIRGHSLGDEKPGPAGGTLTNALNSIKQGSAAAPRPLSWATLCARIGRAIGVYETNRGGDQPIPRQSSLETVAGVRASVRSVGQQIVANAITALIRHPQLRSNAKPPLTEPELKRARERAVAVRKLLGLVDKATITPDVFITTQAAAIAAAGMNEAQVRQMFAAKGLKAMLGDHGRLLPLLRGAGGTAPDQFLRTQAAIIRRAGIPEAAVRRLLQRVARPRALRAVLASLDRARAKGTAADAFVAAVAADLAAAGISAGDARAMYAGDDAARTLRAKLEGEARDGATEDAVRRGLADAIPASQRLGVGVASLMSYTRTPGNWGENKAAWERMGVDRLPGDVGARIVAAAEHEGGTTMTYADVCRLVPKAGRRRLPPDDEGIVREVAKAWNRAPRYPAGVLTEYKRLFPSVPPKPTSGP